MWETGSLFLDLLGDREELLISVGASRCSCILLGEVRIWKIGGWKERWKLQ